MYYQYEQRYEKQLETNRDTLNFISYTDRHIDLSWHQSCDEDITSKGAESRKRA